MAGVGDRSQLKRKLVSSRTTVRKPYETTENDLPASWKLGPDMDSLISLVSVSHLS